MPLWVFDVWARRVIDGPLDGRCAQQQQQHQRQQPEPQQLKQKQQQKQPQPQLQPQLQTQQHSTAQQLQCRGIRQQRHWQLPVEFDGSVNFSSRPRAGKKKKKQ